MRAVNRFGRQEAAGRDGDSFHMDRRRRFGNHLLRFLDAHDGTGHIGLQVRDIGF